MIRVHPFMSNVLGGLLAMMMLASPVLAEITYPTAVKFEKSIYFQKPDGEPIQFQAGIYKIERGSADQLTVIPTESKDAVPTAIQAIPASHEQPIEYVRALLTPAPDHNEDRLHLLLWEPNGVASEAIGSYSGVFSRSTLTWSGQSDDDSDVLTTYTFTNAIYFQTVGGDPKAIQPGEYDVMVEEKGVRLVKVDGEDPAGIVIETSPLDHATAALLPGVGGASNLSLLLIASANGTPLIAVGSDDGTYSRGWKSKWKKKRKARKTKRKAKRKKFFAKVRKGAREVGRVGRRALKNGLKWCAKNSGKCAQGVKMAVKGIKGVAS